MAKKYVYERAWINKKIKSGVSQSELLKGVGTFSNKSKEKVIKEKKLTNSQYKKRYSFLENVYYLLSNEKFK